MSNRLTLKETSEKVLVTSIMQLDPFIALSFSTFIVELFNLKSNSNDFQIPHGIQGSNQLNILYFLFPCCSLSLNGLKVGLKISPLLLDYFL